LFFAISVYTQKLVAEHTTSKFYLNTSSEQSQKTATDALLRISLQLTNMVCSPTDMEKLIDKQCNRIGVEYTSAYANPRYRFVEDLTIAVDSVPVLSSGPHETQPILRTGEPQSREKRFTPRP
jgi:hypothetical protein